MWLLHASVRCMTEHQVAFVQFLSDVAVWHWPEYCWARLQELDFALEEAEVQVTVVLSLPGEGFQANHCGTRRRDRRPSFYPLWYTTALCHCTGTESSKWALDPMQMGGLAYIVGKATATTLTLQTHCRTVSTQIQIVVLSCRSHPVDLIMAS